MESISCWTPIKYHHETPSSNLTEWADNLFFLGGKTVSVFHDGKRAIEEHQKCSHGEIALKVFCFAIPLIPLFALLIKAVDHLVNPRQFQILDLQQELEKGLDLPENTESRINNVISSVLSKSEHDDLEWVRTTKMTRLFKLKNLPNVIFKIPFQGGIGFQSRFKNVLKCKAICIKHDLDKLVIPSSKKFDVSIDGTAHTIIAEQYLNFGDLDEDQEQLYLDHADGLEETVRQLAKFIALSGFNDVVWRNIPLLNETGETLPHRVGLIDLDLLGSAQQGFEGSDNNGSRGLITCLPTEKLMNIAIEEAEAHGVSISNNTKTHMIGRRLEEVSEAKRLQEFYQTRNIEKADTPLPIELDNLGLDLSKSQESSGRKASVLSTNKVSMKDFAQNLIRAINGKIANPDYRSATQAGRRRVFIRYNKGLLEGSDHLFDSDSVGKDTRWSSQVLNALKDNGWIFNWKNDISGAIVQA